MKQLIDISSWQVPAKIDYSTLSTSISGAILRACYGSNKDASFDVHYNNLLSNDIPTGAYIFLTNYMTIESQVNALVKTVKDKNLPLGIWLDVELEAGAEFLTKNTVLKALSQIEEITGKTLGIYTSKYYWELIMGGISLNDHPLWVAHYGVENPALPIGWDTYVLHQYTSSGRLPGYSGNLDLNKFNGTDEQFQTWIKQGAVPAPIISPDNNPLFKIEVICNALNIRSGPGTDYTIKGLAYKGDVYNVYEESNGWYRIGKGLWVSGYIEYAKKIAQQELDIEKRLTLLESEINSLKIRLSDLEQKYVE